MIAVHPMRATSRTPSSESAMSVWNTYDAMMDAASASTAAFNKNKKRKRDSFEAYDFQVHKQQQKMRYSLLREDTPTTYQHHPEHQSHYYHHQDPSAGGVYPRNSLINLTSRALSAKPRLVTPPPHPPMESSTRGYIRNKSDDIKKVRRNKKAKKSKRGSSPRMTKKHYNKKKKLEMMEATDRHIQDILGRNSQLVIPTRAVERVRYYRTMVEQLDLSLRDQCHSIVYKEQDIKSWLGMTTSSRSQIISLRKRLHDRWAEVKDLQSVVKPRRQRLKNLKFAALCEERSIEEES